MPKMMISGKTIHMGVVRRSTLVIKTLVYSRETKSQDEINREPEAGYAREQPMTPGQARQVLAVSRNDKRQQAKAKLARGGQRR